LKSRKMSETKARWKANVVTDVAFRENRFVDDWIIKNDRLNGRKRVNASVGRTFWRYETPQKWLDRGSTRWSCSIELDVTTQMFWVKFQRWSQEESFRQCLNE
jgi:hypothetical protein